MYKYYPKIVLLCLLIGGISFGQEDTLGIVEDKDAVVDQSPSEVDKPEEVSGPQEIDATESSQRGTEEVSEVRETAEIQDSQDSTVSLSVQKSEEPDHVALNKEDFSDINRLREEARILQEQAEKLYDKADDFKDESEDIDDVIEDLEDKADELEDEAEELLKRARELQTCIRVSAEEYEILQRDSTTYKRDTRDTVSSEEYMKDQKMLMLKMRNSADELLIKTKEIAVKVREMKEVSDAKEDLSDRFEDKAEELELKAEELEDAAGQLEKKQDLLPLSVRFPFQLGHQIRFTAVPPFNDRDPHVLILSGLNFSFSFEKFFSVGIEDITLRFSETIYGTRVGITASPLVSFSYFLAKKYEFGVGIGAAIQGQVGADRSYDIASAPFIKLFNENWVANRFSLGPVLKFNFVAKGNLFTRVLPSDKAKVLPEKAWWTDFGITYSFHF